MKYNTTKMRLLAGTFFALFLAGNPVFADTGGLYDETDSEYTDDAYAEEDEGPSTLEQMLYYGAIGYMQGQMMQQQYNNNYSGGSVRNYDSGAGDGGSHSMYDLGNGCSGFMGANGASFSTC